MATTYSIELLSGSTNGKGIKVTGTTSAADVTIHTAVAGTTDIDLVTLWAFNSSTDTVTLTIAWGAETSPDNLLLIPIPANQGPVPIADRMPLQNGLVIGAWAVTANVVMVYGRVERVDKP